MGTARPARERRARRILRRLRVRTTARRPLTDGSPTPQRQLPQLLVAGRVASGFSEPPFRAGVLPCVGDRGLVDEQFPRDQAGVRTAVLVEGRENLEQSLH
jgi:hypothetical protein